MFWVQRARDIAAGALIAAKLRIQAMIQDAVWAGPLPQHLETRLTTVIEAATSTYLSAHDDDEQATAKLYVQKAAQAADGSKQSGVSNTPALTLGMITAMTWTSQRPGRADSVRRSSKRSFHGSLIGLSEEHTREGLRTCATRRSPTNGCTRWTCARGVS